MARGDMKTEKLIFTGDATILNRLPFEGVSMTIDFTNVSADEDTGEVVVKAGTPINDKGVPVNATPWAGAVGILLDDVYAERPQGTILKKAYIHNTRAKANSGLTYDGALVTALANAGCRVVFEEPILVASASTGE